MNCCSRDSTDSSMKGVTYFWGLIIVCTHFTEQLNNFFRRYALATNVLKVSWEFFMNDCQYKSWTGQCINRAAFVPALKTTFIAIIVVSNTPSLSFRISTLLLICLQEPVCVVHMELDYIYDTRSQYLGWLSPFYNLDALLGDAGQHNHRCPVKYGISGSKLGPLFSTCLKAPLSAAFSKFSAVKLQGLLVSQCARLTAAAELAAEAGMPPRTEIIILARSAPNTLWFRVIGCTDAKRMTRWKLLSSNLLL